MRKVSFDFDGTLDMLHVQDYAKSLIEKGIEVHITTFVMTYYISNKTWYTHLT